METELKLLIDGVDASKFAAQPLIQKHLQAPPVQQWMTSTYFDTPELDVRRSDAGLRVRVSGERLVQTLKGGGEVAGGLHRRHEWESDVATLLPDLPALRKLVDPDSLWGQLLRRKHLARRLQPVFSVDVIRTTWQLSLPGGAAVECVLDRGSVICGGDRAPISEIELELKSGRIDSLFKFALALQKTVALRPANMSKAARGYALYAPQSMAGQPVAPVRLLKGVAVEQAFEQITFHCLAQIQSNEAGVLTNNAPESLHRMRVGLRRLCSGFRLFTESVQLPARLLQDWQWLTAQLSAARDWDVLLHSTLPALAVQLGEESVPADMLAAAQQQAAAAHRIAAAAVASPRYCRLQLRFMAWMQSRGWRAGIDGEAKRRLAAPAQDFAWEVQRQLEKRLRRRARKFADGDAVGRHRIRIAAKQTRYSAEFFQSLYPRGRVCRHIESLIDLQDALGRGNDAAVAGGLLRRLQAGHGNLNASTSYLRGALDASGALPARKFQRLWQRFAARPLRQS